MPAPSCSRPSGNCPDCRHSAPPDRDGRSARAAEPERKCERKECGLKRGDRAGDRPDRPIAQEADDPERHYGDVQPEREHQAETLFTSQCRPAEDAGRTEVQTAVHGEEFGAPRSIQCDVTRRRRRAFPANRAPDTEGEIQRGIEPEIGGQQSGASSGRTRRARTRLLCGTRRASVGPAVIDAHPGFDVRNTRPHGQRMRGVRWVGAREGAPGVRPTAPASSAACPCRRAW